MFGYPMCGSHVFSFCMFARSEHCRARGLPVWGDRLETGFYHGHTGDDCPMDPPTIPSELIFRGCIPWQNLSGETLMLVESTYSWSFLIQSIPKYSKATVT